MTSSRWSDLIVQLIRDAGERHTVVWHGLVNGLLAHPLVPSRVRTAGYKAAGIKIHSRALLRPHVHIRSARLVVGAGSTVNIGCVFDNRVGVTIGDRVGVGIGVTFLNTDHETGDPRQRAGTSTFSEIRIEDGAFIGSGVTIMPGVTIGAGVVVAAGAVVTADCAPHGLYAGVPARRKRELPTSDVES